MIGVEAHPRNCCQLTHAITTSSTHIDDCNSSAYSTLGPRLGDVLDHVTDIALVASSGETMIKNHNRGIGWKSDIQRREDVYSSIVLAVAMVSRNKLTWYPHQVVVGAFYDINPIQTRLFIPAYRSYWIRSSCEKSAMAE